MTRKQGLMDNPDSAASLSANEPRVQQHACVRRAVQPKGRSVNNPVIRFALRAFIPMILGLAVPAADAQPATAQTSELRQEVEALKKEVSEIRKALDEIRQSLTQRASPPARPAGAAIAAFRRVIDPLLEK